MSLRRLLLCPELAGGSLPRLRQPTSRRPDPRQDEAGGLAGGDRLSRPRHAAAAR